jgi:hypothetical protein
MGRARFGGGSFVAEVVRFVAVLLDVLAAAGALAIEALVAGTLAAGGTGLEGKSSHVFNGLW